MTVLKIADFHALRCPSRHGHLHCKNDRTKLIRIILSSIDGFFNV